MMTQPIFYRLALLCLLSCSRLILWAQSAPMTLQQCIEYAHSNSLQVQQNDLAVQQSELTQKQAKWAVAPSVNGSFRHGLNLGRSVDLTSYSFVNQTTNSSGLSLNIGAPIYQGFQLKNSIRQAKIDVQANLKDKEQAKRNIALSTAQAYLSVLLSKESYAVLSAQAAVTQAQYNQTLKLIEAGTLPENTRYDLEAQIARDEQNSLNAENAINTALLSLKTLMNFPIQQQLDIVSLDEFNTREAAVPSDIGELYNSAKQQQAGIVAANLRIQSAQLAQKIASGALQPSVAFYSTISTNFSSAAKDITGFDTTYNAFPITIGGNSVDVSIPSVRPKQGNTTAYFNQLNNNLYYNVGVSVNFPIFNGFRARINKQRAELNIMAAELNKKLLENNLKAELVRAINDAKAAQKRYLAAKKTLKATERSVENTQKRFKLGVVNSFELTSVQNTLISSKSNLLQAKYDLLFKLKIIDYYVNTNFILD